MATKTLVEVFEKRAQGIGHILRNRGVWRMAGFPANAKAKTELINNADGTNTIRFHYDESVRHDCCIEFSNIKAADVSGIVFGEETILKSESLGSRTKTIDNSGNREPVDVNFRDLFADTEGHEKTDETSAGTSVSVEVSSSQSIEGVADFDEKITTEAHMEIAESETSSSEITKETEDEESTTVPAGAIVRITESRTRADVSQEVTAHGDFNFSIRAGKHSGGFKGSVRKGQQGYWESWSQF